MQVHATGTENRALIIIIILICLIKCSRVCVFWRRNETEEKVILISESHQHKSTHMSRITGRKVNEKIRLQEISLWFSVSLVHVRCAYDVCVSRTTNVEWSSYVALKICMRQKMEWTGAQLYIGKYQQNVNEIYLLQTFRRRRTLFVENF